MKKLFTLLLMGSVSAANLLQAQAYPTSALIPGKERETAVSPILLQQQQHQTNKTDRETNLPVGAEATLIKS